MKSVLVTGATRGLGLAFVEALSSKPDIEVILGVRDLNAGHDLADRLNGQTKVMELDMASGASIRTFLTKWNKPLIGLINNAGVQNIGETTFSEDMDEITLAVNHLGPFQLMHGLLPHLKGGTVLAIGSGTHNPDDKGAKRFGFRGGLFTSVEELARGVSDAETPKQAGYDRYATSKLMIMAAQVEMARRISATRFLTLDPGLLPGTGLARTAPPIIQFVWKAILPALVPLMPGASTPRHSARAGVALLLDASRPGAGQVFDHNSRESDRVWSKVYDPDFGARVVDETVRYLNLEDSKAAQIA